MPKMKRTQNKRTRPDADEQADDCDELDQATKRRLRNRISQRNFRERKSMYIKELEEQSRINVQSESQRNRVLVRKIAELKRDMLNLRSRILKNSLSLSAIGSDVGKILEVEGSGPLENERMDSRGRPKTNNPPRVASPNAIVGQQIPDMSEEESNYYGLNFTSTRASEEPPTTDRLADARMLETSRGLEDNIDGDANNGNLGNCVLGGHSGVGVPERTTVEANLVPQAIMDIAAEHPTVARLENKEMDVESQPCTISRQPKQTHVHMVASSEVLDEEGEQELLTQRLLPDGWNESLTGLSSQNDTFLDSLKPVFFSNPGSWLIEEEGFDMVEGMDHLLSPEAMETIQSRPNQHDQDSLTKLCQVPSQSSLSLPPGLFPVANENTSRLSFMMQSRLSDHIESLEQYIRGKLDILPGKISHKKLHQCSMGIMSLVTQNAWPSTYPVWFKSQVPEIIGPILLWRLHPTAEAYRGLLPNYRPTELQLTVPHSAVIDWVPHGPLRDRVLLCYNGSIALDRLMCDMLNSYVIEVNDVSKILPNVAPGKGYFGIWNLFNAIDSRALDTAAASARYDLPEPDLSMSNDWGSSFKFQYPGLNLCSPTPSEKTGLPRLAEILATPASLLKLSHDIRLYAAKSWRLDQNLFETWPELKFDGYESIIAQGKSYMLPTNPPSTPIPLTAETVKIYHDALRTLI